MTACLRLSLFLLALVTAGTAAGQSASRQDGSVLRATIVDYDTGDAIVGAYVVIAKRSLWTTTDDAGYASIRDIASGTYTVTVRHLGYELKRFAVTFDPGVVMVAKVRLATEPVELPQVEVTEEGESDWLARRGFYRRQRSGFGVYLTRDELDRAGATLLSDAFRTARGVRISYSQGRAVLVSNRSARGCPLPVFVDGVFTSITDIDDLPLDSVEAVEIYRGPAEVPLAFRTILANTQCGAVLIWTRIEAG